MNDTARIIEDSFKALLKTSPYRSITVKEICAHAHISRNTFYATFHDKRSIVAYLFRRDAVMPFVNAVEVVTFEVAHQMGPSIFCRFYQGIYDNREYYYRLVAPMCGTDPTFELVVARAVYKPFLQALTKRGFSGSSVEADYIAYHYAASQAILLEKWIAGGFAVPVKDIARIYSSIVADHWSRLFKTV